MSLIQLNQLVKVDNRYGIGKVIKIHENKIDIDVCFFIDIKTKITHTYSQEELQIAFLSPHTRVYFYNEKGFWEVGRVKEFDNAINPCMDYLIRFPNRKDEWIQSQKLEVRCLLPFIDPTDILATSGGESQFLYDSRKKVLEWLINLRASSRGLTALTSASIDLVVHQINIVRKILTDPVQRYLLSDEVGMGKTIEAGIIARQCLLDSSTSKVLIIVPKHLVTKWEKEMIGRFYINDFANRFEITYPDKTNYKITNPDLIIIDEAHHILGNSRLYTEMVQTKIVNMAKNSNKLLLLSATPGIGNEDILLNLLKVLDPIIFGDISLESFKEKVMKQSEHGAFLRTLKVSQSPFLLKRNLPKITQLFPNDNYAEMLKNKLLIIIENEFIDEVEKSFLIKQLRSHLIETWRIHNRLIRTRRVDSEGWEFQDRGEKKNDVCLDINITLFEHPNKVIEKINLQIEEWRSFLSIKFIEGDKIDFEAQKRYITLLEATNMDFEKVENLLIDYINNPLIDHEVEFLSNIKNSLSNYNYRESIDTISEKIKLFLNNISTTSIGIIFISDTILAEKYLTSLKIVFEADHVTILDSSSTNDLSVLKNSKIRIVICDIHSEEGIDLQFADAIIHIDLPLNPSRIEQRIGRLDRYGRTKSLKIQHLIVLPTKDINYPWAAWYQLLLEAFKVFHEPISDIQFKLDVITTNIHMSLFRNGITGLENYFNESNNIDGALIDHIRSIIANEREVMDEQYALNHLSLEENTSLNIRDEIEDAEEGEQSLETDINHWLFSVLKFHQWNIKDKIFELQWSKGTLVPIQQFRCENDSVCTDMWGGEFASSIKRHLSYYRTEAVKNSSVSLLRSGHPLFKTLQHYMDWEDRGTAFSTFRVVNEKFPIFIPHGDIRIMFKLQFIVSTRFPTDSFEHEYNSEYNLYMRRTDDYFPPQIFTVYIDENLSIIEDSDITDVLDEPYIKSSKIDTNLSSRHYIINHYIDAEKLDILCRNVSKRSKNILLESKEFKSIHMEAIEKVTIDVELKCSNIERRQSMQRQYNSMQETNESENLISFEKSLIDGIVSPNIKLDSFGMFFLSRFPISELKDINE